MAHLRVLDLRVRYRSARGAALAVDGASFELASGGQALGVIGESGSGKSTLALTLMRLLPPGAEVSGSIHLGDVDLRGLGDERYRTQVRWRRIAMVMQGAINALNPVLRVGQQVAERLLLEGVGRREGARRAAALLERVGLGDGAAARYPHELSGGMRQRVAIAMALALEPELLILDEPTSALDVSVQAQIMNLLKELKKGRGISMLFITHDLALASDLCDTVAVLYAGEVRELGAADDVLTTPRDPYTQALLSSIPRLYGDARPTFLSGSPPDASAPPPGCRFEPRCPAAFAPCRDHAPALVAVDSGSSARCWQYQAPPERAS